MENNNTPDAATEAFATIVGFIVGVIAFGPAMIPAMELMRWMMNGKIGILLLGPYIVAQVILLLGVPSFLGLVAYGLTKVAIGALK